MTKIISLDLIIPDPEQPRRSFYDSEMNELKNSIKEQGILTPLTVESNYEKDKYLLIDGERRYRTAKDLNLKMIPVQIIDGPLSYEERTTKRFHIQMQHSNWPEIDKARAIYNYKKTTNKTIARIAKDLNLHIPKVHAYLSAIGFTENCNKLINENKIDFTYLIYLMRIVKFYQSISEFEQEYIEEKLIKKIVNKTFKTASDFQLFSKMMNNKGNVEEKIKFLENEKYSFEEFIPSSEINKKEEIYRIFKDVDKFDIILSKVIEKKYKLPNELLSSLKTILMKIKKLL